MFSLCFFAGEENKLNVKDIVVNKIKMNDKNTLQQSQELSKEIHRTMRLCGIQL